MMKKNVRILISPRKFTDEFKRHLVKVSFPEIGWPFLKQINILKTGKSVKYYRRFLEDFKLKIVKEYESGRSSALELEKISDFFSAFFEEAKKNSE